MSCAQGLICKNLNRQGKTQQMGKPHSVFRRTFNITLNSNINIKGQKSPY